MSETPAEKQSKASLFAFLGIMLGCLALATIMIRPYLVAIIMGGILSLLSGPVYRRLRRRGLGQKLAASLVTIGLVVLVVGPLIGLSSVAIKQAVSLGKKLSESEAFSVAGVMDMIAHLPGVSDLVGDAAEVENTIKDGLQSLGKGATGFVLAMAKSVPDVLLQLLLACLACFFFLMDGPAAFNWIATKVPIDLEIRQRLQGSFKDTAISVIWASMAAAATQAAVMLLAYAVLGVPAAILAGGATFIFAWIPVVGSTPVWIAGAIYLYMQGSLVKVGLMVAFGIFTGVVDNFVRPVVLKGRGEMHPLVALVAIFGGIQMFGIVGVFFGPILIALVITLLQVWPAVGKRFGLTFAGAVETPPPGLT